MASLSGVTKNNSGAVLVSCEVFLFKYDSVGHTLTQVGSFTTSDAVTGAYTFSGIADSDPSYMVMAFKDGSPNVFDVTDHILQPIGFWQGTANFAGAAAARLLPVGRLQAIANFAGSGTFQFSTTPPPPAPTALLHFDGTNGSATFTDSSGNSNSFTGGGGAHLDTSQAKFGASSVIFNNSKVQGSNTTLGFGAGDYTIDFWFMLTGTQPSTGDFFGFGGNSGVDYIQVGRISSGVIRVFDATSSSDVITGTTVVSSDVWHHIALTRVNAGVGVNLTRLFIDGVQEGSNWNDGKNYVNSSAFDPTLGAYATASFNGWADELRIIVGTAAWTSNFTPPSSPYTP